MSGNKSSIGDFSTILRRLIKERGTTQYAVAEKISLDRAAMSRYCNGKSVPDPKALIALAKHFDVSVEYLLGLEEPLPDQKITDVVGLSFDAVATLKNSQENIGLEERLKHIPSIWLPRELTDSPDEPGFFGPSVTDIISESIIANFAPGKLYEGIKELISTKVELAFYERELELCGAKNKEQRFPMIPPVPSPIEGLRNHSDMLLLRLIRIIMAISDEMTSGIIKGEEKQFAEKAEEYYSIAFEEMERNKIDFPDYLDCLDETEDIS